MKVGGSMVNPTLLVVLLQFCSSAGCERAIPNRVVPTPSTATEQRHVVSKLNDSRKYVSWACNQLSDTRIVQLNLQEPENPDLPIARITPGEEGDQVFAKVAAAYHLKFLGLPRDANDENMKCVAMLTQLESLSLRDCRIRGEGLQFLEFLANLKSLDLGNTWIDDDGLSVLPPLPNLKYLDIGGAPLTAACVRTISPNKFPHLTNLILSGGFCDDTWASELVKNNTIEYISIYMTRFTDKGLLRLAKHQSLRNLAIGMSYVSDNGLAEFQKLRPDVHVDCGG